MKKKEISDKLRNTFFEKIFKSDKLILKLICNPTKVSQCNFTRTRSHFSKQTALGSFDYFCTAELPCVVNLSNMCQYSNTYLFFFCMVAIREQGGGYIFLLVYLINEIISYERSQEPLDTNYSRIHNNLLIYNIVNIL